MSKALKFPTTCALITYLFITSHHYSIIAIRALSFFWSIGTTLQVCFDASNICCSPSHYSLDLEKLWFTVIPTGLSTNIRDTEATKVTLRVLVCEMARQLLCFVYSVIVRRNYTRDSRAWLPLTSPASTLPSGRFQFILYRLQDIFTYLAFCLVTIFHLLGATATWKTILCIKMSALHLVIVYSYFKNYTRIPNLFEISISFYDQTWARASVFKREVVFPNDGF